MNHSQDKHILRTISENPEKGFRLLMARFKEPVYWHIRRLVVSHDDAQDAAQETFIRIWGNVGQLKEEASLSAWVYRIATNEALRILGRNKNVSISSIDDVQDGDSFFSLHADEYVDYDDAATVELQKAILSLPTKQQLAFNMRYYDELEYDDIARILGSSPSSAKANYSMAKQKIIKYMNLDKRD